MSNIKTHVTDASVKDFINSFADTQQKRDDSFELLKIIKGHTGFEPKMWGPSIIGFGTYHYKSEKSRQEGDWPLVGFSPRKAAISLYIYMGTPQNDILLKDLGKFKMGKGCIYAKRLSDINIEVLKSIVDETIRMLREKYPG